MKDTVSLNIAHLNGSSRSISSGTIPAQVLESLENSATTIAENADKVSESATKVEQAVEPLVQASESLDATKQAFEMLSSEWAEGRQAIATALTNRRYPTEPSESFHAMADKITNMSYEEGWFAKIGYTDENDGGIKKLIDYSYEFAKGWNPDGSTPQLFRENTKLVFAPMVDTSKVTDAKYMFNGCSSLVTIPLLDFKLNTSLYRTFENCYVLQTAFIDCSNTTNMFCAFQNCNSLVEIYLLNTQKVSTIEAGFNSCRSLLKIHELDFSSVTSTIIMLSACTKLVYMLIKNLGKSTLTSYDFSGATVWGTGGEENRQSLIDSLITYSYDRASAGMATATIKLSANTKALLTEEEIAQITNKGFTIA